MYQTILPNQFTRQTSQSLTLHRFSFTDYQNTFSLSTKCIFIHKKEAVITVPQPHLLLTDSSPSHCLTVAVILLHTFVRCVSLHLLQNRKNFRMLSALINDDAFLPIPDKTHPPPYRRIYPMPVSHHRFLTRTRFSRQCRPNACDLFHVKDVTTKPHCHATDQTR